MLSRYALADVDTLILFISSDIIFRPDSDLVG
jgi:hypothetical protein